MIWTKIEERFAQFILKFSERRKKYDVYDLLSKIFFSHLICTYELITSIDIFWKKRTEATLLRI